MRFGCTTMADGLGPMHWLSWRYEEIGKAAAALGISETVAAGEPVNWKYGQAFPQSHAKAGRSPGFPANHCANRDGRRHRCGCSGDAVTSPIDRWPVLVTRMSGSRTASTYACMTALLRSQLIARPRISQLTPSDLPRRRGSDRGSDVDRMDREAATGEPGNLNNPAKGPSDIAAAHWLGVAGVVDTSLRPRRNPQRLFSSRV